MIMFKQEVLEAIEKIKTSLGTCAQGLERHTISENAVYEHVKKVKVSVVGIMKLMETVDTRYNKRIKENLLGSIKLLNENMSNIEDRKIDPKVLYDNVKTVIDKIGSTQTLLNRESGKNDYNRI